MKHLKNLENNLINIKQRRAIKIKRCWWKEAVFYQIYPRSFKDSNNDGIGDIKGITSKLDYLKELGIDVVWLSPVYKSPNNDNGYDISDYRDIMCEFGTLKDWDEMLCEMHKRGIKLIMDLVLNHSSDEHMWFIESRKSKDSLYRDYYIWADGNENGKPPNLWESVFGFSAWHYDEDAKQYYLHLFSKKQPDLNWSNPKLREEIYDIIEFWIKRGLDGFRLDAIRFLGKPEYKNEAVDFYPNDDLTHIYLKEMNQKILSKYNIVTVGEVQDLDIDGAKKYIRESDKELNMCFQFNHVNICEMKYGTKWVNKKPNMFDVKKALSKWQTELPVDAWNTLFFGNHDLPRQVSFFSNDSDHYREISAKMLATIIFTLKGTPFIYQGEEIGMTNIIFDKLDDYNDIDTINFVKQKAEIEDIDIETAFKQNKDIINFVSRDNARTPMQWDDSENAGFTAGTPWLKVNPNYKKINVESNIKDSNSVFNYYKKLIELRKKNDVIIYGDYQEFLLDDKCVFIYKRELYDEKVLVIINMTDEIMQKKMPLNLNVKEATPVICNYKRAYNFKKEMLLRPYESVIYFYY